jgi:hypothetical protein
LQSQYFGMTIFAILLAVWCVAGITHASLIVFLVLEYVPAWARWLLILVAANVAGGLSALGWVLFLRTKIDRFYTPANRIAALDWSLGVVERTITIALIVIAPRSVPYFIGGWMALKFAANWKVRTPDRKGELAQDNLARRRLTFLVGSAISFGFGLLGGVIICPHAIAIWGQL